MANPKHVALLRESADAWNRYRHESGESPELNEADLSGVSMTGADLRGGVMLRTNLRGAYLSLAKLGDAHVVEADLTDAKLVGTDLVRCTCIKSNMLGADLRRADLRGACLHEVVLTGADLSNTQFNSKSDLSNAEIMEAKLIEAQLAGAVMYSVDLRLSDLTRADLRGADLSEASFARADLSGADLSGADLSGALLIRTTVEGTILAGARVYGTSVWGLQGTPHNEDGLIVTPRNEPSVTINDLEVAQFVYLLLNNAKIRDVIDTVTAKAVLILGRFIDERKQVLDAIRDQLSAENYVPIIFDFDKPASRDLTETISTLAHLSRFIIADVTDPKSIPQELMKIIPQLPSVPVQPILLRGKDEWSMFDDLKRTGRILATFHYQNPDDVRRSLREKILAPAEKWLEEFSEVRDPLQEIERLREELRQLKAGGDDE
jgi:uncharacterized protein YjbI with pentapeptide repeats